MDTIDNSTILKTPEAYPELNGTQYRFVASNDKGSFTSPTVTLIVSGTQANWLVLGSADSDPLAPLSSGDGSDTGVIVGPIVGVVGGCLLLCCFTCVLLLVLLLVLRRRKKRYVPPLPTPQPDSFLCSDGAFPAVPPDYESVIFGTYLESKFKTKSKHDAALEKLESLLVQGDMSNGSLVHKLIGLHRH